MRATTRRMALVCGVTAGLVLVTAWAPVFGDDKEALEVLRKLEALTRRVESIERALGAKALDSAAPSITDRITTLEKGLGELSRAAGKPRWSSTSRNIRELERTVQAAERQQNDIASRLGQLERDLRDAATCARELRNIRSTLDGLRRSLRDLDSRVRRLESQP